MVNVLISTYNGEKYIIEQLESIFAQTMQDFHIYIRDDGSVDNTVAVINEYIITNSLTERVDFEQGENIGFCQSFFELLNKADNGDCWAFCDQDDVWLPNKLELAVKWLDRQDCSVPLLYQSGFMVGNEDLSIQNTYIYSDYNYQFYNSITSSIYFGFAMVINARLRELLLMADPKNIKYHDWFASMITAAFGKCFLAEEAGAIHRQYNNNASPLYFFKKIPHGMKMLKGERFYTMQAREFKRVYGHMLSAKDREVLDWFQMNGYSFATACKKAFYPHRWNPQIKVEIILRFLMLMGVI